MWFIEQRFIPEEQKQLEGILPSRALSPVFIALSALFLTFTYFAPYAGAKWPIYLLCPLLARLLALDLRYYLLPNIYVLFILIAGLITTPLLGWMPWWASVSGALAGLILPLLFTIIGQKLRGEERFNLGGGDLKFISAAGAWLGIEHLSNYVLLACLFSFIFLYLPKEKPLPFGPGLIVAFFVMLFFKNDVNALLYKFFTLI